MLVTFPQNFSTIAGRVGLAHLAKVASHLSDFGIHGGRPFTDEESPDVTGRRVE